LAPVSAAPRGDKPPNSWRVRLRAIVLKKFGGLDSFRFDEIREAHRVMEANEAHGKMVVVHDR
jgi:hypothetical protein